MDSVLLEVSAQIRLSGTVRWVDGTPAGGFRLRIAGTGADRAAEEAGATPAWNERRVVIEVEADGDGRFAVPGLAEETNVGLSSLDEQAALIPSGIPDPFGNVWVGLPATDLPLVAVAGLRSSVEFVDDRTGGPVGGLEASLDWRQAHSDYVRLQSLHMARARLQFVWPLQNGSPVPSLAGHASARGYVARAFELRDRPETGELVVRMEPDGGGRLTVLHPWGPGISARRPEFSVYCDGRPLDVDALGRDVTHVADEPGRWVFAGLPPGRCSVRCYGVEIARADMAPGGTATVQALLEPFARVVLRPRRDGRPSSGTVRLVTRGIGALEVRNVELGEAGTIELYPLPVGALRASISSSTEVGDPPTFTVEAPGGGATVTIDVHMVPR